MVTLDWANAAGAARARAMAPRVNFIVFFRKIGVREGKPGLGRYLNSICRVDWRLDRPEFCNSSAISVGVQTHQDGTKLMNLLSFCVVLRVRAWCSPRVTPN